jgi:hypothetical protein
LLLLAGVVVFDLQRDLAALHAAGIGEGGHEGA